LNSSWTSQLLIEGERKKLPGLFSTTQRERDSKRGLKKIKVFF
jgi:hypothetical protein